MNRGYIDPITTESLKIKFEEAVKSKIQAKYPKTRYKLILLFASCDAYSIAVELGIIEE